MAGSSEAKRLDTKRIWEGRKFAIDVDRVRLPHGREASLEMVRHPGSVVLVPMPDPQHVILVRQYRYAAGAFLWELPAGSLEPGETIEACARRECHEEIGLVPALLQNLGTFYPSPGFLTETMTFFLCAELREPTEEAAQDEDEHIEPRTVSLAQIDAMVARGDIVDMKTIVGVDRVRALAKRDHEQTRRT